MDERDIQTKIDVIKDRAETFIRMCQFRNRVVHLYNHIDTKTLYEILVNDLEDIKDFYIALLKIISDSE